MKTISFIILIFSITTQLFSQNLTEEELKLYNLIIEYRQEKKLPPIPLSPSLTIVAQTHVKDLADNNPDKGRCNTHSWSDKGKWTSCCYTPNHAKASCMWDKPRELTSYQGNGYEIACSSDDPSKNTILTANIALQSWKSSSGHKAVIINQGSWKKVEWKAIGIGLYKGYGVVWFGHEVDDSENK